jgi:hypothetical protein
MLHTGKCNFASWPREPQGKFSQYILDRRLVGSRACSIIKETRIVFVHSVRRLLFTANIVPSLPILVTLIMEAIRSSETTVHTKATVRYIPEDDILHSHRHENLKSYIALTGWNL